MKILITGGAGFIGSHIVDCLVDRGHDIAVIDNLSTGRIESLNQKAKFYNTDITQDLNEIFEAEKPEIVIHAAAQVMLRYSLENPIQDAQTNILGSLNVLEACRKNNVRRIVYTSTGGARYGEPEYLPIDEKHPIFPTSPYGISKHTVEHYIEAYSKLHNLDYLIFCFGNVYGPRDNLSSKRVISLFCNSILKNESPLIFGDGNQTRDFLYVTDLANFIADSLNKNPEHKLFNLAEGKQVSVNELFRILKELSGFEGNAIYIDAVKGEVRDVLLDTSLAVRELGWSPKHDIKKGLKETFEWFKENLK